MCPAGGQVPTRLLVHLPHKSSSFPGIPVHEISRIPDNANFGAAGLWRGLILNWCYVGEGACQQDERDVICFVGPIFQPILCRDCLLGCTELDSIGWIIDALIPMVSDVGLDMGQSS